MLPVRLAAALLAAVLVRQDAEWTKTFSLTRDSVKAETSVRVGDIDRLGFGCVTGPRVSAEVIERGVLVCGLAGTVP